MISIYHNPQCSKSRACLKILEEYSIPINVILYLKQPLELSQLKFLLKQLGLDKLIRKDDLLYKSLNLQLADENTLLSMLVKYPKLLQRPIVIYKQQAIIARPPDSVRRLLKELSNG